MTHLPADAVPTGPAGPAGPAVLVRGWAPRFYLAWIGVMVAFYGPIQVLLPNQAEALSPDHKEYVLSLVTGVGAAFAMVLNPLWGALSDRTASRFGRRLPWVLAGGAGGVVGLLVLASAPNVAVMVLGWTLVQGTLNAIWAALTAAVPDQVPVARRGAVAGWLGLFQILGVAAAIGVAALVPGRGGYLACAVLVIALLAPYLLFRRDVTIRAEDVPPWEWRAFLRGFWLSPRAYPDFAWGWLTRLLVNLGYSLALVYLLYFLRDELGRSEAEADVFLLTVVNSVGVAAAVVVSGVWSDKIGRRKAFVTAAGLILAAGGLAIALSPTWGTLLAAAFVIGVGYGVYSSVDFALLTQVLPHAEAHGKDLGVLNIAAALPQVLAPVIAAPVVTSLGGYPVLFGIAAALAALGAVLVRNIRSVA